MAGLQVTVLAEEGAEAQLEGHRALLFQSVQELLTNVVKHAGVAEAVVRVRRCEGDGVEVSVEDQGRGFEVDEAAGEFARDGVGLFGIRERLRQMGGSCEIQSGPGRGTKVALKLPRCLPEAAPPAEGRAQET